MPIDTNQFEVIDDAPIDGRFELLDEEQKPDLSKLGTDPYDLFKKQEAQSASREDYPITVPPSLNPNYDFNRATGYGGPITATLGLAADAVGKGLVKVADIPTRIHNARLNASDPEAPFHTDTLEEREARGPIFRLPRVDTKDLSGVSAAVGGVENTLLGTAESMLGKPSSAFTLPLLAGEGALAKAAAGVYGLSTAAQLPEQIQNAVEVYNDPEATTAQKTEAISNPVVQGALSYLMLKHAGPRDAAAIHGPDAMGSILKLPEGAEVPTERFEPLNEGAQNATQERQQPKSNLPEHTGDASERTPAQPGGSSSTPPSTPPQADEPVARIGDARGEPDKEASQIGKSPTTDQLLSMTPEQLVDWKKRTLYGPESPAEIAKGITQEDIPKLEQQRDELLQQASQQMKEVKGPQDDAGMLKANTTHVKAQTLNEVIGEAKKVHGDAELVGMGGAVPSEFNPQGNEARDVYGVAHDVRVARDRAGQVGTVERGVGISAQDSVDHGRQLLKSGVDPEKSLANFEATGKWSSDDIAVTRAHGEQLAQQARAAERKFGTDSPEHKAAFDKLTDWDTRTKKLQTEWHKAGQAQQGQTDIDTGSFTGIAREFKNQTGKDLTPKQASEAKNISEKVSKAADATDTAKKQLFDQLDKETVDVKPTDAERRAFDAANKTVREAAARLAQAETREWVATAAAEKKAAAAERAKEQKALELATDQARDAAIKLTEAENKQRIKDAQKVKDDTQAKAAQDALDAAQKTVREAAERMAKAENDARTAKSVAEKKAAQAAAAKEKKALDIANKVVRDAAAKAAKVATAENVLRADTPAYAWKKAKEYIDSGITNFDDIRNKLATDLGLPVSKVTAALAKTKRAKFLTDELWKKQQEYRRLDQLAKRWIADQQTPLIQKALRSLPNLAFAAKVFGHGTVALGTHAPMVAFQPRFWKAYANDFIKMYRMVGSPAFYEQQVQDLLRRPNYTTARRAGLVNDPYQFEDYNSPEVTKWMGPVANMGNRGYSVLKMLRQDMFDQMWNKLPKTTQIPEVAKALADGINHATGVVRMAAPKGSSVALFAPRLEASRAAWLVVDPLKAAKTFTNWKNASEGDKQFAINQVKEKAWVVGTMLGLLAANEGVLEATNSKQRVNFNDPMKRDWMKFKVGGMNIGYGNAMLSMARLPARLYKIRESDGGKLKNLVYPDEDTYSVLGEFARSQESPFASLATSLWFKSDWQNRPLPNSDRPVPKRLRARGVQPYTWPEFWTEQVLPIPAEEAAREVWQSGLGMNPQQVAQARKALATIAVMAATGSRVEEDTEVAP